VVFSNEVSSTSRWVHELYCQTTYITSQIKQNRLTEFLMYLLKMQNWQTWQHTHRCSRRESWLMQEDLQGWMLGM